MNEQLLISGVLEHAIKNNANTEIVSNTVEGGIHRYTIKAVSYTHLTLPTINWV